MPWLQLTITATQEQAPLVEELFAAIGALAVTYGDAATEPLLEPAPGEIKLWQHSQITALFAAEADVDLLCAAVKTNLAPDIATTLKYQLLEDQVWERAWLADFPPRRFGERLWVCADGQSPPQADAVVIDLDPGLAFGTDSHPTTALCLNWLDQTHITGQRVLDYGCGSGILAIAAAKLGAIEVTAIDYDPQALEATKANAVKNGVTERLHILPPALCPKEATYDCVLANILAGILIELEPQLATLIRPGGKLALSGILEHQVTRVAAAYHKHFELESVQMDQEWILWAGIRRDC